MDPRKGSHVLLRPHSILPYLAPRSQTLAAQRSFHFSAPCAQQAAARAPAPERESQSTTRGQQPPVNSALPDLVAGLKRSRPEMSARDEMRRRNAEASQNYLRNLSASRSKGKPPSTLPFNSMSDISKVFDPSRVKGFVPKGGNIDLVPDAGTVAPDIGPAPEPPPMKLGPALGRNIRLQRDTGVDLETGMRRLDMLVSSNRIRTDSGRQKFHERAGLKRKRLKSERWRRRFRVGFHHMCSRAIALKRQGW